MITSATVTSVFRRPATKRGHVVTPAYTGRDPAGDRLARGGALVLHFFLSYAHGDHRDDEWVARFSGDLATEIRALTGDDQDTDMGFLDNRNLHAGVLWPRALVDALSSAHTFIALCSPRYFRSRYCGQEWAVFADRLRAYRQETGRQAPSIIPVFWIVTDVPASLGDIQYRDKTFGARYEREGLRELMRLDIRPDYATFVRALAIRVHKVATAFPLPPAERRPDFHSVSNAFGLDGAGPNPPDPTPVAPDQRDPGETHPRMRRPILEFDPTDLPDS